MLFAKSTGNRTSSQGVLQYFVKNQNCFSKAKKIIVSIQNCKARAWSLCFLLTHVHVHWLVSGFYIVFTKGRIWWSSIPLVLEVLKNSAINVKPNVCENLQWLSSYQRNIEERLFTSILKKIQMTKNGTLTSAHIQNNYFAINGLFLI